MLAKPQYDQIRPPKTPESLFDQRATDLIRQRSSWRRYQSGPIPKHLRHELTNFIAEHSTGPFASEQRFELVAATESDGEALRGLGTYGFIKNPAGFVVGAVKASTTSMEDYGHAMERMVLRATDLGLGTCWIGGTFRRSRFAERIDLKDDEILPAIFSVGMITERRGTVDRIIRWGAKSKNRRPWDTRFFDESFDTPLAQDAAGRFAVPLEMLRLAPSASNRQPWRVVRLNAHGRDIFHFYVKRSAGYTRQLRTLRLADLQRIDMGIAMSHFELAAQEAGIEGRWAIDDPGLALPDNTEYIVSYSWRPSK